MYKILAATALLGVLIPLAPLLAEGDGGVLATMIGHKGSSEVVKADEVDTEDDAAPEEEEEEASEQNSGAQGGGILATMIERAGSPDDTADEPDTEENAEDQETTQQGDADIADKGDLLLKFVKPKDKKFRAIAAEIEKTGTFRDLVNELNRLFAFPRNINVVFDTCGQVNAFYDPQSTQIILCLELFSNYYPDLFSDDDTYSKEDIKEMVEAGSIFTLFHELGHALIDQWDLAVLGREEDAVDRLGGLMMLKLMDDGGTKLGHAVAQFGASAAKFDEDEETEYDWSDVHSLDWQRHYDLLCMIYGSDPKAYKDLVTDGDLPKERAELCPGEMAQIEKSWMQVLAPYYKG